MDQAVRAVEKLGNDPYGIAEASIRTGLDILLPIIIDQMVARSKWHRIDESGNLIVERLCFPDAETVMAYLDSEVL